MILYFVKELIVATLQNIIIIIIVIVISDINIAIFLIEIIRFFKCFARLNWICLKRFLVITILAWSRQHIIFPYQIALHFIVILRKSILVGYVQSYVVLSTDSLNLSLLLLWISRRIWMKAVLRICLRTNWIGVKSLRIRLMILLRGIILLLLWVR